MAKKFTLKTSRNGGWEVFYPKAHWDNIENKPNNIINGADTGYTPVTGSLIYYECGAFKTIAPSSDNEILTLENGIPKWKDIDNLTLDTYGKGLSTNDYTDYYKGELDEYISRDLKDWKDQAYLWNGQAGYWWKAFDVVNDTGSTHSVDFTFTYKENYNVGLNSFGILKLRVKFSNQTATLNWVSKTSEIDLNRFVAITNGTTTSLYIQNTSPNGYPGCQLALQTKSYVTGAYTVEDHATFNFYSIQANTSSDMLQTLPSGTQYVSTMLDQTLTTNSVEPAYDSLNAIDYNKEYGYVVDNHTTAGTTWGKIFSYEISQAYKSGTFVFDVNYGYYNRTRCGRLKLYTRIEGDTNTLTEAYLYFESKSEDLDMSMFKVRRFENKAEIYVKTARIYEGVSLKLVQVCAIDGKTYLQDSAISNFTLHNVTKPTMTTTEVEALSGEVTEPSLLPISIENNSNIRTQQAEFDYNKEGASVFFNQAEIYFEDRFNSFTNTMFDLAVYHKMYETGHIPISKNNMPDTSNVLATTQEIATEQFYVTNSEWNSLLLADIASVQIEGTYNSSVFRNVTTSTNNPNGYANIIVNKNKPSGSYFISFKIVDEFGKEVITTHKTILGIPL